MEKTIAILPGDGIGPEVMRETIRVLDAIAKKYQHQFHWLEGKVGGSAYDVCQSHCPEETITLCQQADAILFGSVGGPVDQQHREKWQDCEKNSILALRKCFHFNINIRPIVVTPELAGYCPLKDSLVGQGFDFVIFRELTGGVYFGRHEIKIVNNQRVAMDESIYDEGQIKSIAHAAFQSAQARNKKLCSMDKANVLATSRLWREVVSSVANEYRDVSLTHLLIDNGVMQIIKNPHQFDVILTENMFGDIISDLSAVLPGSLGLTPSASMNDKGQGLYEPSGGSAPDIAGKGIANPTAQILSAAMMLRHSFSLMEEAALIEEAVKAVMAQGIVTADLSAHSTHSASTQQFVDALLAYLAES